MLTTEKLQILMLLIVGFSPLVFIAFVFSFRTLVNSDQGPLQFFHLCDR